MTKPTIEDLQDLILRTQTVLNARLNVQEQLLLSIFASLKGRPEVLKAFEKEGEDLDGMLLNESFSDEELTMETELRERLGDILRTYLPRIKK